MKVQLVKAVSEDIHLTLIATSNKKAAALRARIRRLHKQIFGQTIKPVTEVAEGSPTLTRKSVAYFNELRLQDLAATHGVELVP